MTTAVRRPKTILSRMFTLLMQNTATSGILMSIAAILAMMWANSSWAWIYTVLWKTSHEVTLFGVKMTIDGHFIVADILMTIFFLVVGLEIRREMTKGELRERATAILPVCAAVGGMIVPALLYLAITSAVPQVSSGWGIPIATDIAFAIAVLGLVSKRVPIALRVFLLSLAIIDDIGAVVVIAFAYTSGLLLGMLCCVALLVAAVYIWWKKQPSPPIIAVAGVLVLLWVLLEATGIHPCIAGVIVGLLLPTTTGVSERLERWCVPLSALVVMPMFALASLGLVFAPIEATPIAIGIANGIVAGLLFGKPIGVFSGTWIGSKLFRVPLPKGVKWYQILGVGCIAGVGFTMSIFVAELAFVNEEYLYMAKISILIGSLASALAGVAILTSKSKKMI